VWLAGEEVHKTVRFSFLSQQRRRKGKKLRIEVRESRIEVFGSCDLRCSIRDSLGGLSMAFRNDLCASVSLRENCLRAEAGMKVFSKRPKSNCATGRFWIDYCHF
jgi:hypothetical protein